MAFDLRCRPRVYHVQSEGFKMNMSILRNRDGRIVFILSLALACHVVLSISLDTPALTTGADPCDCTLQFLLRVTLSALILLACGVALRAYTPLFLFIALVSVWPAHRSYRRCENSCGPIESSWRDSSGTALLRPKTTIDQGRRRVGAANGVRSFVQARGRLGEIRERTEH